MRRPHVVYLVVMALSLLVLLVRDCSGAIQ
jgi:hypothetical protein